MKEFLDFTSSCNWRHVRPECRNITRACRASPQTLDQKIRAPFSLKQKAKCLKILFAFGSHFYRCNIIRLILNRTF